MKLFPKLFLAFLLASGFLIVGMALLINWSFRQGLENYLHQSEMEKLERLVPVLEQSYAEAGGWEAVARNRRRLRRAIRRALREFTGERPDWNGPPLPRPPPHGHRHPPPRGAFLLSRIRVLDTDKRAVFGPPRITVPEALQPLKHQGEVVGWVGLHRAKAITNQLALAFQSQQRRHFIVIAALGLLISALVAWWLVRQLLRPIQQIAAAARGLGGGDYQTRVGLQSHDELGQLAADFNRLAHTLELNERARRQWVADISHELRTPLAVLRGEIEAIQDGVRAANQESLNSLHHEALNLGKLVDDLYELALSDAGALDYRKQRVDLAAVLAAAVDAFAPRFATKNLTLENRVTAPVEVFADARRLEQLCRNLLENSLRYTDPGGRLDIDAGVGAGRVSLWFQDSAPGVAEEELEKLFERLYRVDKSRSRALGGAGLGLSICRNIVAAHGGEIHAAVSSLGGLRITVELPCHV